ncbi:hypothetical protein KF840_17755 [bacterium]|nr:hypothetical protein [bacterium]
MPTLDPRAEQQVQAYAAEVVQALGEAAVGVVLYGSAAGADWVAGRSDINTAIVLRRVAVASLDALAPVVARWRPKGFALPVLLDEGQVAQACRLFPMELDDIRRQHRLLAGSDPFLALGTDEAALRRECAQEAFGKLLRLRAYYVEHAARPADLATMMLDSIRSFVTVTRHLLRLRGMAEPPDFAAVLAAGETVVGPLPALRRVLAQRQADNPAGLGQHAASYVDEIERLVAAVVADCA